MRKIIKLLFIISPLVFVANLFTLINQSISVGSFWRKAGEIIGFGCIVIFALCVLYFFIAWLIGLFRTTKEPEVKAVRQESLPEAGKEGVKEERIASTAETVIRKLFGIILIIATIPLFLNILTLPTIIIFLTFAAYCLKSRRYRLDWEIFWTVIAFLVYFAPVTPLAWDVYPGLKATRLEPALNTGGGFGDLFLYVFAAGPINFCSLAFFLLANDIAGRFKKVYQSPWRGLLAAIIFLTTGFYFLLAPFVSPIIIEPGYGSLSRGGSGKGIEKEPAPLLRYDKQQDLWIYNFWMKNNLTDAADIEKIYGDKSEITPIIGENLKVEGADFEGGKIVIKPDRKAEITLLFKKPFGIITFQGKNTGVMYDFWR